MVLLILSRKTGNLSELHLQLSKDKNVLKVINGANNKNRYVRTLEEFGVLW